MTHASPSPSSAPSSSSSSSSEGRVEEFVRRAGGPRSEADVAAGTGLDLETAARALRALSKRYDSVLLVGDDGRLVYDFGPQLQRLGAPTWRDRLAGLGRAAWRAFSWVYKASLAAVLVSYAVVFVVIIVAAAIAAAIAAEDDSPASAVFDIVRAIFHAIFEFATALPTTYTTTDRHGYAHKHYTPRPPPLHKRRKAEAAPTTSKPEKSFIASVYDFVLGPARVEAAPDAQERECAAFVRSRGGGLTIADVQAMSGLSREDAGRFFARFVAQHDGIAEITEDGALVARFPSLLQSHSTRDDAPVVMFWDEYEPPHELTGNSLGRNLLIGAIAAFNLACAGWFVGHGAELGAASTWLGLVPAGLFSSFFAIPLLRAPFVWLNNRAHHANNIRRRIYRVLFERESSRVSLLELVREANAHATTEERLDVENLQALLQNTLHRVGGELDSDQQGSLRISLERLQQEIAARKEASVSTQRAEIVHSTA